MEILKETGIVWREKKFISNLYMDQSVEVRLRRGDKKCEDWKRS
jgi:hypothetical protein